MRRRTILLAVVAGLTPAGCAAGPEPAPPFNDTDVMFAQMSLEHIGQGDPVVALAERRAADPAVRELATELRAQWRAEAGTLTGRLNRWGRPLTADPDAGAHAGHGDLHSLRESDVAELAAAGGQTFDRTALSLLLGHLHNGVETARMETAGGRDPEMINLAAASIRLRQSQVQRMLTLLA